MDIEFSHEQAGDKGRYVAMSLAEAETGEATYSRVSPTRIIVDHIGVPESLGGKGVGSALARHIVEQAREHGFTIVPLCPFMKAQAERNPDWADVVEGDKADAAP